MLTCSRCEAEESLESPFIDGVCCDCWRKETYRTHPAERTREFLPGLDRSRIRTALTEQSAPTDTPTELRAMSRRSWLPKLHMRDFIWLTLLFAIGFKAFRDHQFAMDARTENQMLSKRLETIGAQRNELQASLDRQVHTASIESRRHARVESEMAAELNRQFDRTRQNYSRSLLKGHEYQQALHSELKRFGLEVVECDDGTIELQIQDPYRSLARPHMHYYPRD